MKKKIIIIALLALVAISGVFALIYSLVREDNKGDIYTQTVGEYALDGRNVMRKANTLVLYTKEGYSRNEYGYEVLVDNATDTVIAKDVILEVTDGAYVLSGHGDAGRFLKKLL